MHHCVANIASCRCGEDTAIIMLVSFIGTFPNLKETLYNQMHTLQRYYLREKIIFASLLYLVHRLKLVFGMFSKVAAMKQNNSCQN